MKFSAIWNDYSEYVKRRQMAPTVWLAGNRKHSLSVVRFQDGGTRS